MVWNTGLIISFIRFWSVDKLVRHCTVLLFLSSYQTKDNCTTQSCGCRKQAQWTIDLGCDRAYWYGSNTSEYSLVWKHEAPEVASDQHLSPNRRQSTRHNEIMVSWTSMKIHWWSASPDQRVLNLYCFAVAAPVTPKKKSKTPTNCMLIGMESPKTFDKIASGKEVLHAGSTAKFRRKAWEERGLDLPLTLPLYAWEFACYDDL